MATHAFQGPANRGPLEKMLGAYPGGRHIVDHVDDGPHWLVPILSADRPNWQASAVLAAYPGVLVPMYVDEWSDRIRHVTVHAVPQFGREMLEWHNVEDELAVSERIVGPFDAPPGAAQIVAALPTWLGIDDGELADQLTAALTAAADVSGTDAVLTLLADLRLAGTTPEDDLDTLTAALAALTD